MKQSESHVFHVTGWHQSYRMIERGEGIYLFDTQGKRYLDGMGGSHVVTIGHGVAEIADAIAEQTRKFCFLNKVRFTNEPQERLARVIAEMAPEDLDRVIFVTGGSTANEIALQVARYYHLERGNPGKYKVISRWHGYCGRTIGALSMSGSLFVKREDMAPYDLNFPRIQSPHCYQCPYGRTYPGCELVCATELARTIEQQGPETVSAFIAEPIVGGAGSAIVPPAGYYEKIREICDAYDVLFITEEIITGFGRTGKNFGIQHWNATPDVITTAKGLSSGYAPIGAVIVHRRIQETLMAGKRPGIPTFLTYSGHPISCAAALAVQDYIAKHDLMERCRIMGRYLKEQLRRLAEREPLIGDVRGEGLLIGIEFVEDKVTRRPFPRSARITEQVVQNSFEKGLVIRGRFGTGTGRDGDHILISPAFIVTEAGCDELVKMLESAIGKVARSLG
uniref:N(6)-acetyl-beta-lysine transaminase n=1 Tax=Candidatus Kentrum sp. FW TaxID=2126338 RepID=A0A450S809_9GAMM|nr:MAG: N(6)-acetyl-beta-lysine transaminase precursor [Candidatus Kentron sp. FW]